MQPLPSEIEQAVQIANRAFLRRTETRAALATALRDDQMAAAFELAANADLTRLVKACQEGEAAPATTGTMFRTAPDALPLHPVVERSGYYEDRGSTPLTDADAETIRRGVG